VFILVFGVVTLGLGWFLFFLFTPISVIWALVYYGLTLAAALAPPSACAWSARNAHLVRRPDVFPARRDARGRLLADRLAAHPFVLLVGLFNDRKRLLHDMLVGTVVINAARAGAVRRPL
jgi:uncharacterized RDD family membrane protein YckC